MNGVHRKCTSYTAKGAELHSFIVNGIISAVLIIPGVILNSLLIFKYTTFSLKDRHRNSNFLIMCQAVGNLFNVLVTSPLMGGGYVAYYTNLLPGSPITRENSCPYWYMISQWAVVASVTGRLLLFSFAALDRLYAVWKPVYWYNHLNGQYSACKCIVLTIWCLSGVYSLGEVYGHGIEFFSPHGDERDAQRYHDVRAVVCLLLTLMIVGIWAVTFYLTYATLGHTSRIKKTSMLHTKESGTMRSTTSIDRESICLSPISANRLSPSTSVSLSRSSVGQPSVSTNARSSLEPPTTFASAVPCGDSMRSFRSSLDTPSNAVRRDSGYASPAVICSRLSVNRFPKQMNENKITSSKMDDQMNDSYPTDSSQVQITANAKHPAGPEQKPGYLADHVSNPSLTEKVETSSVLSEDGDSKPSKTPSLNNNLPESPNQNDKSTLSNKSFSDHVQTRISLTDHSSPKKSTDYLSDQSVRCGSMGKSHSDHLNKVNPPCPSDQPKTSYLSNNLPAQLRISLSVPLNLSRIAPPQHPPLTSTLSESTLTPDGRRNHHYPRLPARLRHFTPSCTVLAVVEWKLIRIFATMLSFFLIGYIPILFYLVACLAYPGVFQAHAQNVRIVYATGSTSGLVLASCLCPLLVLLSVKNFKIKGLRKRLDIKIRH